MELPPVTVVDFSGDLKTAALYFDYVFPVAWSTALVEKEYTDAGFTWMLETIAEALIPPGFNHKALNAALAIRDSGEDTPWPDFLRLVEERLLPYAGLLQAPRLLPNALKIEDKIHERNHDRYARFLDGERIRSLRLPDVPMPQTSTLPANPPLGNNDCAMITLASLQLVDASKLTWQHLMEFRRDETSRKRLMGLRAFTETNYAGKSKQFVEAALYTRLEQYKKTTKAWGFETVNSALSLVLSSGHLLGAAVATWSSILLGHPALAALTATGGVAVELGKITLHLMKRRFELTTLQQDHPLGYLLEAEKTRPPAPPIDRVPS